MKYDIELVGKIGSMALIDKKSNILDIDPETKYNVLWRRDDYTILKYKKGRIKVPNVLLPYFMNDKSILYFKNGKFHKDLSK